MRMELWLAVCHCLCGMGVKRTCKGSLFHVSPIMGQHPSQPHSIQRPLPRRSSTANSASLRQHRKKSLEFPEFAALSPPSRRPSYIHTTMAASVIQQPPSPPHTRQHYFPPIHHPAKPQYVQPPIPQPPAPRPAPVLPPVQEEGITVRSKLPLGFHPPPSQQPTQAELEQQMQEPEGTQEATITWRGGGKDVYLTGADTREPRVKMIHE